MSNENKVYKLHKMLVLTRTVSHDVIKKPTTAKAITERYRRLRWHPKLAKLSCWLVTVLLLFFNTKTVLLSMLWQQKKKV